MGRREAPPRWRNPGTGEAVPGLRLRFIRATGGAHFPVHGSDSYRSASLGGKVDRFAGGSDGGTLAAGQVLSCD
jgi:hypothetical protein